ncbi:hypothetical protein B0I21_11152 [Sphingobacterium paludis]|uniref:Uncharacterized protein n=1 Tax=Sphingobacterium paludis TaxID=1476465 RepID=A0A4V3E0X6_9SPHI|nr:hypothetical protein B0I21_11152 [Sphingobacterium paludis]
MLNDADRYESFEKSEDNLSPLRSFYMLEDYCSSTTNKSFILR